MTMSKKDRGKCALKYDTIEKQAFFQTAWFIECIISETLMIFYIRSKTLTKSRPSNILLLLTGIISTLWIAASCLASLI